MGLHCCPHVHSSTLHIAWCTHVMHKIFPNHFKHISCFTRPPCACLALYLCSFDPCPHSQLSLPMCIVYQQSHHIDAGRTSPHHLHHFFVEPSPGVISITTGFLGGLNDSGTISKDTTSTVLAKRHREDQGSSGHGTTTSLEWVT